MTKQTIELLDELTNEDASEMASFLFDELALTETAVNDIKAGRDYTVGPPAPCPGCNWGPPLLNHNETVAEDGVAEAAELADLSVAVPQAEEVKGGVGRTAARWEQVITGDLPTTTA